MTGSLSQEQIDALLQGKKEKDPSPEIEAETNSLPVAPEGKKKKDPVVERVEFAQFRSSPRVSPAKPDYRFFNSVPLLISGELGTVEITVRELLKLEEGSVIKLNKMVGDSSTLLVNEHYLGQAEVVVINDRFGMRITTIGPKEIEVDEGKETLKTKRRERALRHLQTTKNVNDVVELQEEKE